MQTYGDILPCPPNGHCTRILRWYCSEASTLEDNFRCWILLHPRRLVWCSVDVIRKIFFLFENDAQCKSVYKETYKIAELRAMSIWNKIITNGITDSFQALPSETCFQCSISSPNLCSEMSGGLCWQPLISVRSTFILLTAVTWTMKGEIQRILLHIYV